jgi:hypothetical protein
MRIISIDVGIKNLAYCLIETGTESGSGSGSGSGSQKKKEKKENKEKKEIQIIQWDIINLTQPIELKCMMQDKKGEPCQQIAKYKKDGQHFCLKHSKKSKYQIMTKELTPGFIQKQKIQELQNLVEKYKIPHGPLLKKADLVSLLHEYFYNTCLDPIEQVNASKLDLVTIGKNIQKKFDVLLKDLTVDNVIIENQISPIANRMKTIQGMIAQYFIMKNNESEIDFVNASNKLKGIESKEFESKEKEKKKTSYSERKKLGIEKTAVFLEEVGMESWKKHFETSKKKDDLADCFLQALRFLYERQ